MTSGPSAPNFRRNPAVLAGRGLFLEPGRALSLAAARRALAPQDGRLFFVGHQLHFLAGRRVVAALDTGRDIALRCPRPKRSGGRNEHGQTRVRSAGHATLRSATGSGASCRPYESRRMAAYSSRFWKNFSGAPLAGDCRAGRAILPANFCGRAVKNGIGFVRQESLVAHWGIDLAEFAPRRANAGRCAGCFTSAR